jgi:hypothetical protein
MPSPDLKYSAAVDYVTLTLAAAVRELDALRFRRCAEDALDDKGPMSERKAAQVLGYRGQRLNQAFYGARPDGWMFRSSGETSDVDYARDWPVSSKCTRIDLAVTVWRHDWPKSVAREMRQAAIKARDEGRMHRSTRICFYDGCGDGDSCYIGSRSSDQMLRCYDKGAESGETRYNGAWRWEIEFKGQRACQVWEALCVHPNAAEAIVGTVQEWITSRGVGVGPGIGDPGGVSTRVTLGAGDDTARLEWIARSIAPVVGRLIDRHGKAVVYSALGLPE